MDLDETLNYESVLQISDFGFGPYWLNINASTHVTRIGTVLISQELLVL
jgi:hypothetical protein